MYEMISCNLDCMHRIIWKMRSSIRITISNVHAIADKFHREEMLENLLIIFIQKKLKYCSIYKRMNLLIQTKKENLILIVELMVNRLTKYNNLTCKSCKIPYTNETQEKTLYCKTCMNKNYQITYFLKGKVSLSPTLFAHLQDIKLTPKKCSTNYSLGEKNLHAFFHLKSSSFCVSPLPKSCSFWVSPLPKSSPFCVSLLLVSCLCSARKRGHTK